MKIASIALEAYKSSIGLSIGLDVESAALVEDAERINCEANSVHNGLNLLRSYKRLDRNQKRLESIAQKSIDISFEIRAQLNQLRLGHQSRERDSPKKVILAAAKKDSLEQSRIQLRGLQNSLQTGLLINLWYVGETSLPPKPFFLLEKGLYTCGQQL